MFKIIEMRRAMNSLGFNTHSYCRIRNNLCKNVETVSRGKASLSLQNSFNKEVTKLKYSTLPSSKPSLEKSMKDLLQEYPQPKNIILEVLKKVFIVTQSHNIEPTFSIERRNYTADRTRSIFCAQLHMFWPKSFKVEGISYRKNDAENIAYLYACQKLKEYGVLDEKNQPILPSKFNEEELKTAKSGLYIIFDKLWPKLGSRDYIPRFETSQEKGIFNEKNVWKTKLVLGYPEKKTFSALSTKSVTAENIASLEALNWLQEKHVIDENKKLILGLEDKQIILARRKHPCPFQIDDETKKQMPLVVNIWNEFKYKNKSLLVDDMQNCQPESTSSSELINIITDEPYRKLTNEEAEDRNHVLYQRQRMLQCNPSRKVQKIHENRLSMPTAQQKNEILHLIHDNQVVVLSGETGCGKSTQVPQYILDSFINESKGSECSIIVTQPRRISAISLAERVAVERGEQLGQAIGYQIRLKKRFPENSNGAILFCTTGMLLKKLCFNPNLEGISHIIIDEVHERSVQIDFLLILLKNLLERNKDIKLILMSASINTHLISRYFDQCPIINIPGSLYPVKEYYLEDFEKNIDYLGTVSLKSRFDVNLLSSVIQYVDSTQSPGSILCFLPGWNEIKEVHSKLLERFSDTSKYSIILLHSKLSPKEQKLVFVPPYSGVRKIVLATNVAECSITIDDVVHVIDCGFHKETSFDFNTGTSSLDLHWISKANVKQRRGRSGRTQPGSCFYVYPKSVYQKMDEYPTPEIQRISLENIVLNCKLYCATEKAEDFLSKALEHPDMASIKMGVETLSMMDILDHDENLTTLGNIVVNFATHPRLSKTLVMAAFLRCVDPILTISAFLTIAQDPFLDVLDKRREIKLVKASFDKSNFSDHISMYKLFCKWDSLNADETSSEEKAAFLEKTMLDEVTLIYCKQLKNLFAQDLYNAGLIDSCTDCCTDLSSKCNQNSENTEVVLSALASGFYPNIVKVMEGKITREKISNNDVIYRTLNNQRAEPLVQSVVSKVFHLPSPYLAYFSALKSEVRSCLLLNSISPVPGVGLFVFAGKELVLKTTSEPDTDPSDEVVMHIDDCDKLSFVCSAEEAQLVSDWRQCMLELFQSYLKLAQQEDSNKFHMIDDFIDSEVLPILKEVLKIPQVPFIRGEMFVRSNGEIVSKDI